MDIDGFVASISWSQVNGPITLVMEDINSFEPSLSHFYEGEYQFVLTAIDNQGLMATDTVSIQVKNALKTELIFPNPVISIANLKLSGVAISHPNSFRIYSIAGIVIHYEKIVHLPQTGIKTINLSHLVPGTYVIEVTNSKSEKLRQKFIKQ